MKNYNLPNFTDADNKDTWEAAYNAMKKALKAHPPSDATKKLFRRVMHRNFGNATPAQALLLLATLGPQAPMDLDDITVIPGLINDRSAIPATCTQSLTVKELFTLTNIVNGHIKQAADKMAFIVQADQATLQRALNQLTADWHKNHANVILPGEGVGPGKYLRGWLRINELFPPVRDANDNLVEDDLITNLF